MRPSDQTIHMEMSFICLRVENHFHIKGWALNLVLIQRPRRTRWWPIDSGATSQINRISSTQRSYLKLIELKISGTCISMIFLTEIIDEGHLYAEFIISFQLYMLELFRDCWDKLTSERAGRCLLQRTLPSWSSTQYKESLLSLETRSLSSSFGPRDPA